ncbi:MAG: DNA adenine methylase [Elusimicrobiota bacterium]
MTNTVQSMLTNLGLEEVKNKAKPFLKWVGGKRQLLEQFEDVFPKDFNIYHEPMVGGGAVFFHLTPKTAVINDTNEDLMRAYEVVRDNVDELIDLLKIFKENHNKDFYYKTRDEFNELKKKANGDNKIELTARLVYMNRTCFNGLYRVNQKGEFNVPIGRYKNPTICDEDTLRAVSQVLENVQILCGDFEKATESVATDDFVYFDPPYDPVSDTANFTEYTNGGFGKEGQKRLAQTFRQLDKRDVKVALSNSDTDFIKNLYQGFNVHILKARRHINSNADGRGEINEVLITNF